MLRRAAHAPTTKRNARQTKNRPRGAEIKVSGPAAFCYAARAGAAVGLKNVGEGVFNGLYGVEFLPSE